MTDYSKLDAWIDAHFDEEVKFLQEMVRVPTDTPPGNNAPHAERAADMLKIMGLVAELAAICERRGVSHRLQETMRAAAAPSAPEWQQRWERAVESLGLPVHRLPSGAGHDAMKMHALLPQAMLFVRGENAGISHNPLESSTSHDIDLAVQAFARLLANLASETR